MSKKNILSVENISMQFGGVLAVNDLSLKVDENEIVALIGPNGAGKTTAFNCITGIYEPTSGRIIFNNETVLASSPRGKQKKTFLGELPAQDIERVVNMPDSITRKGMARTFQNIRLFSNLSVIENVLIAKHTKANQNVFSAILRLNRAKEARMIEESERLLKMQGLIKYPDAADRRSVRIRAAGAGGFRADSRPVRAIPPAPSPRPPPAKRLILIRDVRRRPSDGASVSVRLCSCHERDRPLPTANRKRRHEGRRHRHRRYARAARFLRHRDRSVRIDADALHFNY